MHTQSLKPSRAVLRGPASQRLTQSLLYSSRKSACSFGRFGLGESSPSSRQAVGEIVIDGSGVTVRAGAAAASAAGAWDPLGPAPAPHNATRDARSCYNVLLCVIRAMHR